MPEYEVVENVIEIPMSEVHADDNFNCRGQIAPIDVVDLAKSIEQEGLIQPVTVSKYAPLKEKETGCKYLLIAGYRRHAAHLVLGRKTINAIVKPTMPEAKARIVNLAENLERQDLNVLQEAKAIERLKELGLSEFDTAKELNKSRGWVQIRYMLLDLPEEIQQECAAGIIKQVEIRALYSIGTREERLAAAKKLKEQVQRGEKKAAVEHIVKKKSDKRIRKRPEIFSMMEHMQNTIGNGLHTRALAWVAGEITDLELFTSIKCKADAEGVDYTIPNDGEY